MGADLTLHGDLVTLREFRVDDVDDVFAIEGDDRVTRWLSFDARTRDQAVRMVDGVLERRQQEPRVEFYMAVTVKGGDDRCVGSVRLAFNGVQAGKLGYSLAFAHWGSGYATDAARTLVGYGFTELGRHRVSAAIGPDNASSIRLVERLGMTYEGRIRDHVFTNGAWRDSLLYSVLEQEWTADAAPRR